MKDIEETRVAADEEREGPPFDPRERAGLLGVPFLGAADYPEIQPVNGGLSLKFMRQYKVLPLGLAEGALRVVMADPADAFTIDAIRAYTGTEVAPCIGDADEILDAVEKNFGEGATTVRKIIEDMDEEEIDVVTGAAEEDADHLRDLASEAPVIRLVNLLISRAAELGASDIHFEPFEEKLVVRYRVDGVLHDVESPPKRLQAAIVSRVKLMAKMNIAERRLPQDGRIRVRVENRGIDIRVSTVPTVFGESLVLRLLDRGAFFHRLDSLGFEPDVLRRFSGMISRPYGMILVCGPTGSGKTTTLYAVLDRINSHDLKIITIEDPVEYQITGVNQIQVAPKIDLTFAKGLRSIVRQDPDILLVGEVRDQETADIAVQSALTGHLVFSTVHTNDAAGAVTRLADMGVEHYLIASSIIGILAQRLVRRVCPDCARPAPPDAEIIDQDDPGAAVPEGNFVAGEGCENCGHTGYRGRMGIFELLVMDDAIRDLVLRRASSTEIRRAAIAAGMITLRGDGLEKARRGGTTLAEVIRVTQEE